MPNNLRLFVDGFASEYFKSYISLETLISESHPDFYGPFLDVFRDYLEDKDGFNNMNKLTYQNKVGDLLFSAVEDSYRDIGKQYGEQTPLVEKPKLLSEFPDLIESLMDFEERCLT